MRRAMLGDISVNIARWRYGSRAAGYRLAGASVDVLSAGDKNFGPGDIAEIAGAQAKDAGGHFFRRAHPV